MCWYPDAATMTGAIFQTGISFLSVGRRIDAVVFDLDNTLVDSGLDFHRMKEDIREYVQSKLPDIQMPRGGTTTDIIEYFRKAVPDESTLGRYMLDLHSIMDRVEMESVGYSRPLGNIPAMLADLRDMAIKIGLLTRSCEAYARLVLGRIGSVEAFDAMSCRTPNGPTKPDPAALLALARKLDAEPGRILFVGDHVMDGQCARAAGALFAAVRATSEESALRALSPVAILDDLDGIPLLVRRLNETPGRGSGPGH